MSVHVSSWAWRQQVGDATAKLLLVKLADMANDDGLCWPGQARLAAECEMSERSVQRKLVELKKLGLLTCEQRGLAKSNVYRLLYQESLTRQSGGSRPDTAMAGQDPPRVAGHKREPSVEPSEEPIASLRSTNGNAEPKNKSARKPDPIWDQLVLCCKIDQSTLTTDERGHVNRSVKQLREIGAPPDEFPAFASWWGEVHPGARLTHACYRLHWSEFQGARKAARKTSLTDRYTDEYIRFLMTATSLTPQQLEDMEGLTEQELYRGG